MSHHPIPSQRQIDALRGLVRSGTPLTDEQRDHLARLPDAVAGAAVSYGELLRTVPR